MVRAWYGGLGQVLSLLKGLRASCDDSFALILLLYQGIPPQPAPTRFATWCREARFFGAGCWLEGELCRGEKQGGKKKINLTYFTLGFLCVCVFFW